MIKNNKLIQNLGKSFSFYIDSNYVVIILVALTQGFTGLSDLALSYLYKDDLNIEPSTVSKINSFVFIPWILKPIYGLITDSFPICGYRRKPYLFFFGLSVMFCWILMSIWADTLTKVVSIVMINQISTAFCNVIGEALVVEVSQKQKEKDPEAGSKNVSLYFLIKSIGSLITAFSSGALLEILDKRKVFLITAIFPLLIILSSILLDEKKFSSIENLETSKTDKDMEAGLHNSERSSTLKQNKDSEFKKQLDLFLGFLSLDIIYKPVIFIFLYMIAPSYGDPLFYFYTNELKFSPFVMGRLKLIYGIASVLGIWIFNKFLRNVGFKKIMWSTTILSMTFNMFSIILVKRINIDYGIPDFIFCMTADALTTALAEINTMPLLVLACNICPKNIEGTLYAFLMSVLNLGSLISNQLGSSLTSYLEITAYNFTNLPTLIFIANIVYILPMPSLYLVDETQYSIKAEDSKKKPKPTSNEDEETKLIHSNNKSELSTEEFSKSRKTNQGSKQEIFKEKECDVNSESFTTTSTDVHKSSQIYFHSHVKST